MQMQDLNKNQIVLLVLLISFVTSIATGIMTVSLLQEAPIEVTRNINRIVEKTIETVTPSTILTSGQKEVTTVVVKEEDLIISSINKNVKSIVRINEKNGLDSTISFYGIGLVITKEGLIAADRKTISNSSAYNATMSDGVVFQLTPVGVSKDTNFLLFKAELPKVSEADQNLAAVAGSSKFTYTFVPATLSDKDPQLGQTLISLGGDVTNSVSVGRIISLDIKDFGTGTTTTKSLIGINTDLLIKDLSDGSPLFNLSGDVVGIKTSPDSSKSFTPVSVLKKEINILTGN